MNSTKCYVLTDVEFDINLNYFFHQPLYRRQAKFTLYIENWLTAATLF